MTATVALIGANGHGRVHRRSIAALQAAGRVRLVGLADVRPIEPDPPVPAGTELFTDHRRLLEVTRPDVVVICSPPHTHLPIALDALASGCDLLLEKPPVRTLEEHHTLAAAVREAGRACQVGFQALGSPAAALLDEAVAGSRLTGIATVAAWQRDDAYWARSPWAGRHGVDGALVNPFAHALMQCLAVAAAAGAGAPRSMQVERYRTRPIETDDTAFARITFAGGLRMLAAVTLAGEDFVAGEVIVDGDAGRAVLEYPTDRLARPGDSGPVLVPGRVDLLENLLAHRTDPALPLLAPLARTAPFTAVLESLAAPGRPAPALLGPPDVEARGAGPGRVLVIRGINAVLRRAAEALALPSELGVGWAVPAYAGDIRPVGGQSDWPSPART
jgi:predicted dehydrogenase